VTISTNIEDLIKVNSQDNLERTSLEIELTNQS
jgi:hypothetical protein